MENSELKMWLVVRADLLEVIPVGKLLTQAGHGYGNCLLSAYKIDPIRVDQYVENATPKITCKVKNEGQLLRVADECRTAGIVFELIRDAGRTVFREPTLTCVGFGPCYREELPPFLKRLQLLEAPKSDTVA